VIARPSALALIAASLLAFPAHAGSSVRVVVTVVLSSGPCGASVTNAGVTVSCGSTASLPLLPPVSGLDSAGQQALLGGALGPVALPFVSGTTAERKQPDSPAALNSMQELAVDGESNSSDDSAPRQPGVSLAWAAGDRRTVVYSGANLSSWRIVSNDNAQHVELTISW
jgi:hypothetical protein